MRYIYLIFFALLANLALADAKVLVLVDGKAITSIDVDKRIEALRLANPTFSLDDSMRQRILTNLVSEELFHNEAKRLKISVSDEEITDHFKNLQKEHGFSEAQTKLLLNNQSLWKQARSQVLWSKLIGIVFYNKIKVSDAEIRDEQKVRTGEIREVTFKQIIFENFDQEKATKLHAATNCQILDQLSKEYGLGKPSQNTLLLAELNPELQSVIRMLPLNQVSETLNFQNKKQLIMVCNKDIINNPQNTQEIRQELSTRKINAEAQKYLAELKKRVYIEYIDHN